MVRRRLRLLAVPVALLSVALAGSSCSGTPGTSDSGHIIEPSVGCGRPLAGGQVAAGQVRAETLVAPGVSGSYDLSVPRRYRARHPTPLILLFYGFDSDPAQFSTLTGLPAQGSDDGSIVAVPHTQGAESEWQFDAHGTDATFVDSLVVSLERTYCIDRHAVFAAGFSAGAAFTVIYSCARQAQITAIATVAVEFQLGCTRPMPILAFHGTQDPLVPYQNGAIGLSLPGARVRGTQRNMGDWALLDRCHANARRTRIGSQVDEQQWQGCALGTSVTLYTVIGGGHAWPGANPKKALGLTTQQVNATSKILSFFGHVEH